uniref:Uncharacterized protein LOC111115574 n=1 Tax=Crassostrea virginica TaxID=6565 RepID=A0A8B8C565_CRAVI|nr:uncharacterized protein LOC111115574 [Crassostrea virginica]
MEGSVPQFVLYWTVIFSIMPIKNCRLLGGYEFPVYTTTTCPRNEFEFEARSNKTNCTETTSYMCLPNHNMTELLEFCYYDSGGIGVMTGGRCFYLDSNSSVEMYKCSHFTDGCPTSTHYTYRVFDYPSCWKIKDGCFLADPKCGRQLTTADITNLNNAATQIPPNGTDYGLGISISLLVTVSIFIVLLVLMLSRNLHKKARIKGDERSEEMAIGGRRHKEMTIGSETSL